MKVEQINKPHEIFCEWTLLDPQALEQFRSAMEQPWVIQGALMPDTHKGYSLPIGAIVATEGVVVPAWVGYDIGCGICALPTTFKKQDVIDNAQAIHQAIHDAVPISNDKLAAPQELPLSLKALPRTQVIAFALEGRDGLCQLGTLGGGNHFIEVGYDETDQVWIIIHSGSRGVGHQVADVYMKAAAEFHGVTQGNIEGHYGWSVNTSIGSMYLTDMNWCLEYALENRRQMLTGILAAMGSVIEGYGLWRRLINRTHNHAEVKGDVVIHRKGATHAEDGMLGVIPGNMLQGSYIVAGKGNPDSLCSSSHGAGRVLSRNQAKKHLDVEVFEQMMSEAGIASDASASIIDESPLAYKPIDEVMAMQRDLVDIVHHVRPLINVKG